MILGSTAATATAALNKLIKMTSVSKHLLDEPGLCYHWRLGNIHYTKSGNGKPLLLIHNLFANSGGFEWKALIPLLEQNYTVYNIDLLGCGHSEKPNMTYTNYLFVQLISDFIQSEIGHRTNVIAAGESTAIALMACANNPELFDQMLFINPLSLLEFSRYPGKISKIYKLIVDFPIVGTLLYHIAASKKYISEDLIQYGFYNPHSMKQQHVDFCHEAAHLGKSPKSLYASVKCKYTRCNIVNALKKIDNSIYLIGGKELPEMKEVIEEYKTYNSAVEIVLLPHTKALPHLESPEILYQIIKTYLL